MLCLIGNEEYSYKQASREEVYSRSMPMTELQYLRTVRNHDTIGCFEVLHKLHTYEVNTDVFLSTSDE